MRRALTPGQVFERPSNEKVAKGKREQASEVCTGMSVAVSKERKYCIRRERMTRAVEGAGRLARTQSLVRPGNSCAAKVAEETIREDAESVLTYGKRFECQMARAECGGSGPGKRRGAASRRKRGPRVRAADEAESTSTRRWR